MRALRNDLVVVLLVVVAFAAGNIWLARHGAQEASGLELIPVPSAFNGGPSGLRGLYLLWRDLGFDTRVWRRPWSDLPGEGGLLVVAAPFFPREEIEPKEARHLLDWVRAGHSALLLGGSTDLLAPAGLRMLSGTERRSRVAPSAPTGLMTDVNALSLSQDRWAGLKPPAVIHARDRRGPALVSRPLGRGQLIALSDGTALANGHLKEADNAVLAANLAALAEGPLYFDEYHHGWRERRTLASVLVRPPLLWVTLQVGFALLLFLHAASRRFGPPVPPAAKRPQRASTEYVAAMASLYQVAEARDVVLQRLSQGFRREVARALGLPQSASVAQLAEAAARRSGVDPARLTHVLAVCEGQVPGRARPKESLLLWAGFELETLRRQVLS